MPALGRLSPGPGAQAHLPLLTVRQEGARLAWRVFPCPAAQPRELRSPPCPEHPLCCPPVLWLPPPRTVSSRAPSTSPSFPDKAHTVCVFSPFPLERELLSAGTLFAFPFSFYEFVGFLLEECLAHRRS